MQTQIVEITNRHGLHARACAKIVQVASRFRCNVALVSGMRRASGRSIVAVMLLAAAVGTPVYACFRTTDPKVWAPRGPAVDFQEIGEAKGIPSPNGR